VVLVVREKDHLQYVNLLNIPFSLVNIPNCFFSSSAATLKRSNRSFSYSCQALLAMFILPSNSYGPLSCARRIKSFARDSRLCDDAEIWRQVLVAKLDGKTHTFEKEIIAIGGAVL
jgi:hypothetical protein